MRKSSSGGGTLMAFLFFWVVSALISIAFSVACVVVAWHFIAKYW